jgi:hypothetical protein
MEVMEMTVEATGLEVLDIRTDALFAARHLHMRDIGMQMAGLQRPFPCFVRESRDNPSGARQRSS